MVAGSRSAESGSHRPSKTVTFYFCFSRSVFNAPLHAMTWSNMALTDFSCWEAGLKTLKFSKSVNMESKTWLRTVAICTSASTRRSCSTARAPPAPP